MLWRSNGYLPVKSPHLPPTSTFSSLKIPNSVQNIATTLKPKLLLYTLVLIASVYALLSWLPNATVPAPERVLRIPRTKTFPTDGIQEGLAKLIEPIQLREFVIEPQPIEWQKERSPEEPVPWRQEELLPTRPSNLAWYQKEWIGKGKEALALADGEPIPRHRMEVYPREIELKPREDRFYPEANELLFGTTTTVERAKVMSELWSRWLLLPGNDEVQKRQGPACMILLSDQEKRHDIADLRRVLDQRGLPCGVRTSSVKRYEVRVLSMTKELRDYAGELGRTFKWYVFADDDTFWLDLVALRRMLGKYDPTKNFFVGATTESMHQLQQFGRMAFGGAGMLVSDPLMLKMFENFDECRTQFAKIFGGDEMITRCAALAKGATKQTVTSEEKGLHQFDVPGDTTGLLQSGIPLLNLHHYIGGSWVHLFGYGSYREDFAQIQLLKRVVSFLGGDNMFKRYVFGNGRWLFVLGYSITIFEEKLTKEMMVEAEHTWYDGYRLSFEDRPLIAERRADEGKTAKQTFYIDDIKVISPQVALLTYVQADAWHEHMTSEERVRLQVYWDGCWQGGEGCDTGNRSQPFAAA